MGDCISRQSSPNGLGSRYLSYTSIRCHSCASGIARVFGFIELLLEEPSHFDLGE